jgi:hypothetical protein
MRKLCLEDTEVRIILNLLPKGDVPEGLDPTFYHTLSYDGDMKLQKAVDKLREKLENLPRDISR